MTSNTTRPTKTKAGGPHHCNQLKNLKEEHIALQNDYKQLSLECDQLHVEASQSVCNLQERNYYKKSACLWIACSVILTASWVIFAVML